MFARNTHLHPVKLEKGGTQVAAPPTHRVMGGRIFFGVLDVVKVLNRGALKEQLMTDENIVSEQAALK